MNDNIIDFFNNLDRLIIPFTEIIHNKELNVPKSSKTIQNVKKILATELKRS